MNTVGPSIRCISNFLFLNMENFGPPNNLCQQPLILTGKGQEYVYVSKDNSCSLSAATFRQYYRIFSSDATGKCFNGMEKPHVPFQFPSVMLMSKTAFLGMKLFVFFHLGGN